MAFIRTSRGPARGRQSLFVPGSLACAAARPLALSASVRWAETPHPAARPEAGQAAPREGAAPSQSDAPS